MSLPRLHRIADARAATILRNHLWSRAGHPGRTGPFGYDDLRALEPRSRRKVCAELAEFMAGTIRPELHALHPELGEVGEDAFRAAAREFLASNAEIKTAIIAEQTDARRRADTSPPDQQDAWRRLNNELNRLAKLRRDLDFTETSFASLDRGRRRQVCALLYPDPEYTSMKANQLGMTRSALIAVSERFFAQNPEIHRAVLDDFADRQLSRYLCRTAKIAETDDFDDRHLEALPITDGQYVVCCLAKILDGTLQPPGLADALRLNPTDLKRAVNRFLDSHPQMDRYVKVAMAEPPAQELAFTPDATPAQMVRHYLWSRLELPGTPIDFADDKQFHQLDGHLQSRVTREIYQLARGRFGTEAQTAFDGVDHASIRTAAEQLRRKAAHIATEVRYLEQSQAGTLKQAIEDVTGVHHIDDLNESIFDSLDDTARDAACDLLRLDPRRWADRGVMPKYRDLLRIAVNDFLTSHPWMVDELRQNALERNLGAHLTRSAGLRPVAERLNDSHFPQLETGATRRLLQTLDEITTDAGSAGKVAAELGTSVGNLRQAIDFLLDSHPAIDARLRSFRAERSASRPAAVRARESPVRNAVERFVEDHGMTGNPTGRGLDAKTARTPARTAWTVQISDRLYHQLDAPAQKWATWFTRRVAIVNHPEKMLMKPVPGSAVYTGTVRETGAVLVAVAATSPRSKFGRDHALEFVALYGRAHGDGHRELVAGRRVPEFERHHQPRLS